MAKQRTQIIEDYFRIMDSMRRLNVGPFQYWHQQRANVTRAQLGVLMLIHRHHLNTVKDLADHLGISASAATQVVNGLVTAKLLQRTTDAIDRRKTILTLSKTGHAFLKKIKQGMQHSVTAMFQPLSDVELRQLVKLQQKILNYFQSNHEA